ncbi:hypothetical protein [Pseudomonas neuropathica]|uniref:hypothetical protein n=1 Tax=Pseudomonas neuropathica TaxID=2730425 RepID=UPI003EBEF214
MLEAQLITLLKEANQLSIKVAQHQLDLGDWHSRNPDTELPQAFIDNEETLTKPLIDIVDSIYLSTLALLSVLKLTDYQDQFKNRFGLDFNAIRAAEEYEIDNETGHPYNTFLIKIHRFLKILGISTESELYYTQAGIKYLETILKNTAAIVHNSGKTVKSETEVYKCVKHVIQAIFPTSLHPKSNFIKQAQEYKPDILIPELFAAVEYKFATTAEKLKATIAQLSDDIHGYSNEYDYRLFYAVFYVTQDFIGLEKFNAIWKEKQYPKNWKAFYIVGS